MEHFFFIYLNYILNATIVPTTNMTWIFLLKFTLVNDFHFISSNFLNFFFY